MLQLDSSLSYPPVTEIVLNQIFPVQTGDIGERQTGEAGKDKDVPDQFKPGNGESLLYDGLQFVIGKEYRVGLVLFHPISVKGVFAHPLFCQCHIGELLETFHVTDYRVPAQAALCFQVDVERADELRCQFMKRDVLLAVVGGGKLPQLLHHILVSVDGNGGIVYVHQAFHLLNAFLHGAEQRTHSGVFPEYTVQNQFRGYQSLFQYQFLVLLKGTCMQLGNIGVQRDGCPVPAFATSFGRIP